MLAAPERMKAIPGAIMATNWCQLKTIRSDRWRSMMQRCEWHEITRHGCSYSSKSVLVIRRSRILTPTTRSSSQRWLPPILAALDNHAKQAFVVDNACWALCNIGWSDKALQKSIMDAHA